MPDNLVLVFITGKNLSDSRIREIAIRLGRDSQNIYILSTSSRALFQRSIGFLANVMIYNNRDYLRSLDVWTHLNGFASIWVFDETQEYHYTNNVVPFIPLSDSFSPSLRATS